MAIQIHTVPAGSGGNGYPVAGSILAVAIYPAGQVFNNQAFVDANIAAIELPADVVVGDAFAELIGGKIATPQAAGAYGDTTFADAAAFNADLTPLPDKFKLMKAVTDFYYFDIGGGVYGNPDGESNGSPLSLTITTPGLGYTIGAGKATSAITGNGQFMTVEITSVGGNGEITGVAVDETGVLFEVGDTLSVIGGDGAAVLEVASLEVQVIGTLNTGRGASNQASADDINPSYFTSLPFQFAESDLELYIPSSGQILSYDASLPAPYKFDSLGDCFVGADYRVQVRPAGSTDVIAEVICPGPQDVNSDIDFGKYST